MQEFTIGSSLGRAARLVGQQALRVLSYGALTVLPAGVLVGLLASSVVGEAVASPAGDQRFAALVYLIGGPICLLFTAMAIEDASRVLQSNRLPWGKQFLRGFVVFPRFLLFFVISTLLYYLVLAIPGIVLIALTGVPNVATLVVIGFVTFLLGACLLAYWSLAPAACVVEGTIVRCFFRSSRLSRGHRIGLVVSWIIIALVSTVGAFLSLFAVGLAFAPFLATGALTEESLAMWGGSLGVMVAICVQTVIGGAYVATAFDQLRREKEGDPTARLEAVFD